jgi:two-component system chemotaxis response regulator CheB
VVIGGSRGALQTLHFIGHLPADFPAAIFVVVHVAAGGPGLLAGIMRQYSGLPVDHAHDNEAIAGGRIYVARPDHHLIIREGFVQVAGGPKENRHRPSIDVLFRSAAESYGPRVIGVILSGNLDDGSAGLVEIKAQGGLAIVQDPKDALFPDMPRNAIAQAEANFVAPRSQLAALLTDVVVENTTGDSFERMRNGRSEGAASEVSMDGDGYNAYDDKPGTASNFSCPDCGGVLRQIEDDKSLRFRCRVGHALSGQTLLAAQSDHVEQALWSALRALEEKAAMVRKLEDYSLARNFKSAPRKFAEEAKHLQTHANVIRKLLGKTASSEAPEPPVEDR